VKIVTVVGARPQFIKAWAVSPILRQEAEEILVHTGQHYDQLLSGQFFEELHLPRPDYELGVGPGSPPEQMGRMLTGLSEVLAHEKPDGVLVYGDTNSTLAGALAAATLDIPVAHVEAGLRSYNRAMPEETNRVLTDHVATRLYCPTPQAVTNLAREGIQIGVLLTGDVMAAALRQMPVSHDVLHRWSLRPQGYYVATIHRKENTDDRERLANLLRGLASLDHPVIWPLHPRTEQRILAFGLDRLLVPPIRVVPPLGYREMISLVAEAQAVLTDSGGLQREAAYLGVPGYVLREETEWVELVETGQTVLVGTDPDRLRSAVASRLAKAGIAASGPEDPVGLIVADLITEWGHRHA